jgi:guanine deaminase
MPGDKGNYTPTHKDQPEKHRRAVVPAADRKRFMQMAVDLAEQALDAGKGGPFGAIVVRGTRIAGSSGNCVFKHTDPTAHAEIMAIRDACENLDTDDLTGCDIYSSGEPCPMCMAAIYWARIDAVYFCNTEKEALAFGFIDKLILAELRKRPEDRKIKSKRIGNTRGLAVFRKAKAMGVAGKTKKR